MGVAEPIDRFAIERIVGTEAILRFDGDPIPDRVQGRVIEGQFSIGDRYLVVLCDDVPYEERLSFHLFDTRLRLVDALELGAPYAPGVFRLVGTDAGCLTFTFESERRYALRVFDTPRRLVGSAPGVRRSGGLFRPHLLQLRTA